MANKIQLLDCTLRDGGYVNDWAFGFEKIAYLFQREAASGTDFIEVGFLDERRPFDPERTIQPDTKSFDRLFKGLSKGSSKAVAMIDYGTCPIGNVAPSEESFLDGIRVIFKKDLRFDAIRFSGEIKALGYQVFVQAVSITDYDESELKSLIELVNGLKPYAVSMVDTYGLLDRESLKKLIRVFDDGLDPEIALGFHAHNNFQLGFSNVQTMLETETERTLLVDGSLYGMGKSAGNAPIELIAMHLNDRYGKAYDVNEMQEAISTALLDIYEKTPWGYKLFFFIAASNRCHPDYVSFLMNKRTLSVTAINEILSEIPEDQRLKKNMKLIEKLYLQYQTDACSDAEACALLREKLFGREVLLLGPGERIRKDAEKIRAYIEEKKPVVFAVNHLYASFRASYLFLTNSRRYHEMAHRMATEEGVTTVATSNVTKTGGSFDYVLNYASLIDPEEEFPDNSLIMALKTLEKAGAAKAVLAGFDGYTPYDINFYDGRLSYDFVREKSSTLNEQVKRYLAKDHAMEIRFLTKSRYEE